MQLSPIFKYDCSDPGRLGRAGFHRILYCSASSTTNGPATASKALPQSSPKTATQILQTKPIINRVKSQRQRGSLKMWCKSPKHLFFGCISQIQDSRSTGQGQESTSKGQIPQAEMRIKSFSKAEEVYAKANNCS